MTDLVRNSTAGHAIALLNHYSFDLEGYSAEQFVQQWASSYQPRWVRAAVIEALYQGRYKAVSVGQILAFWHRRGEPLCHFNHEFERIICSSSPQNLTTQTVPESLLAAARKAEKREPEPSVPVANLPGIEDAVSASVQPLPSGFGPASGAAEDRSTEVVAAIADATLVAVMGEPLAELIDPPDLPAMLPTNPEPGNEDPADLSSPVAGTLVETVHLDQAAPTSDQTGSEPEDPDLPVRLFQSDQDEEPSEIYQANWSRSDAGKHPIHQFVPTPATPEFHEKLKAVAQQVKG